MGCMEGHHFHENVGVVARVPRTNMVNKFKCKYKYNHPNNFLIQIPAQIQIRMWNVCRGPGFHEIEGIDVTGANPEMESRHNLVTRIEDVVS